MRVVLAGGDVLEDVDARRRGPSPRRPSTPRAPPCRSGPRRPASGPSPTGSRRRSRGRGTPPRRRPRPRAGSRGRPPPPTAGRLRSGWPPRATRPGATPPARSQWPSRRLPSRRARRTRPRPARRRRTGAPPSSRSGWWECRSWGFGGTKKPPAGSRNRAAAARADIIGAADGAANVCGCGAGFPACSAVVVRDRCSAGFPACFQEESAQFGKAAVDLGRTPAGKPALLGTRPDHPAALCTILCSHRRKPPVEGSSGQDRSERAIPRRWFWPRRSGPPRSQRSQRAQRKKLGRERRIGSSRLGPVSPFSHHSLRSLRSLRSPRFTRSSNSRHPLHPQACGAESRTLIQTTNPLATTGTVTRALRVVPAPASPGRPAN